MIYVVKADGTREPFSEEKVLSSMKRAHVPHHLQNKLLSEIKKDLYDNIQTWEIYQKISELLGKSEQPFCKSRYGLKQAIMMLGPTGYPFEDYVAEVLKEDGYLTLVRQIIAGTCVSHEVDVVAVKDSTRVMIEAKFHNNAGARSDLQVAMYTKARFDDIKEKNNIATCWLVTNTKATTDAISYAQCTGVKVVSWNYPEGESLREKIEKYHLFPITALCSISHKVKLMLLDEHIVLCKQICENPNLLNTLHLPSDQKKQILDEIHFICDVKQDIYPSSDPATQAFA